MDVKPAKRRRFRYSLRGLMLLILVLCIGLGVWAEKARRQRLAVAAIFAQDGFAAYDYEMVNGDYQPGRHPSEPKWLLRVSGIDFFHNVLWVWVALPHRDLDSAEKASSPDRALNPVFAKLADLPGLRKLTLNGPTDAEIGQLRGLTELEVLNIVESLELSDAGVQPLSNLKKLKILGLKGRITDKGLSHLSGLRNLETLSLLCMGPQGEGENYSDGSKPITGKGLKYLRGMTKLRTLVIDSDQIGDEGLSHLEGLDKLESLTLINPHLTDAGLRTLAKIPRLKELSLDDDDVITPEAIASFKKSRPNVQLIR